MDQLKRLLNNLTWKQRVSLALAAVAVVTALVAFSRWTKERDFKPLFTELSPEDAGAVITRLKESGVEYELNDAGNSVLVPSAKVAELRLQLASSGIPRSGRIGFELFDKSNFGATEFSEQVNYHRAVEGELERTVMSLGEVEQARVHITWPKESVYTESREPAKASVLVKLRPGAHLSPQNIQAICHLTASAVQGLAPEAVSLVDTAGDLLNRPRPASLAEGGESSDAMLEYRRSVERDLQNKVVATLDPLLGADRFRVGVSADCDFSSGEQSEETFDPSKSVMVNSQRTEDGPAAALASGVPGTASNLPRPTSRPATGTAAYSRRTENIAYQSSRLVKHTRLPIGTVKRVSLSVLVDHSVRWVGAGAKTRRIVEAPSPEKLKVIHDLVAAATGIQPDRGDQLVVESFPFESTANPEPVDVLPAAPAPSAYPWAPPWLQRVLQQKNFAVLAGAGAGGALALVVLLVFLLRGKKKAVVEVTPVLTDGRTRAIDTSPEAMEREVEAKLAEQQVEKARQAAEALMNLRLPAVNTKKTEVLTKHIAAEAKKDPITMAQVVRSWLNASDR